MRLYVFLQMDTMKFILQNEQKTEKVDMEDALKKLVYPRRRQQKKSERLL